MEATDLKLHTRAYLREVWRSVITQRVKGHLDKKEWGLHSMGLEMSGGQISNILYRSKYPDTRCLAKTINYHS